MNIIVLGIGLQGKAAVYDLATSRDVSRIYAVDSRKAELEKFLTGLNSDKVEGVPLDVKDVGGITGLMKKADGVICLLPIQFREPIARSAVEVGVHYVDASYAIPEYKSLHQTALKQNVVILPECGLDPGIDLVLAAKILKDFEEVYVFRSYGTGIPAPEVPPNPIRYKISWTFAGVLSGYQRPARIWKNGNPVEISPGALFEDENVHLVDVESFGTLEAYPNGDVVPYLKQLGIEKSVREAGRYSMRWEGHCEFWRRIVKLGFLDDTPIKVGDAQVSPRRFVYELLLPRLQYDEDERDAVIIRVEVEGISGGIKKRVSYDVIDYRDEKTGFLGMQRTVGFTASIGLQMVLKGQISRRGLLSPLTDIPIEPFFTELEKRNIRVRKGYQEL